MTGKPMRHATRREIADLDDGRLAGPRAGRVQAHLRACAECTALRERQGALVAALAAGPLPAPPRTVLRRAHGLLGAARRAALLERAGELLAGLVLDQRLEPAPALRSGPGGEHRLLWRAGELEIVAALCGGGGGAHLLGEVLAGAQAGPQHGVVELLGAGGAVQRTDLDPEGCFAFRDLPPGTYALRGEAEGVRFRTPPFRVD